MRIKPLISMNYNKFQLISKSLATGGWRLSAKIDAGGAVFGYEKYCFNWFYGFW
ncbi:MAG: hypothetical protein Q8M92_09045 [Candidatus Subteraquimicrobiales bacterium]|nr:hypothetical protein [Candidatus Subteraquimicrobiales bacterium]